MHLKQIEYDQTVGKGILAALGYVERPTHPELHKRLVMHAEQMEVSIIGASVTMIYKPDPTLAHMLTFAVLQAKGENLGIIQNTFGKIANGRLKLDAPEEGLLLELGSFNHSMLHAHPVSFMLNLQKSLHKPGVSAPGRIEPTVSVLSPNIEYAAEEALRDVLKRYGKSGLPPEECNA